MDCVNKAELEIINKVRMLWMEHSEWTRMAITSIVFDNPDKAEVIDRLLRNPVDFGEFLRKFYGDNIAFKFCTLLTEHLTLAAALVEASLVGDTEEGERINSRFYENADEIAALLSTINPYWHFREWQCMLYMHLDLVKKLAAETINGSYEESIKTYDKYQTEIMQMAKMMYEGLIKQFCNKKKCRR